jgi:UDPglucose--hexose-1-phosphate uridylyltransferase
VFEEGGFVALTPFASANAGEVLLVPVEHATSFSASAGELRGQARALKRLVGRCRAAFDDPAYNLMLHDAPVRAQADPAVHWYWRLSPRRTIAAGFELGSGVRINSLAPEQAAVMLRGH